MGQLRVRDKQTGVERTVTEKAYSIIPHRYTVLGKVDDDGSTQPYSTQQTVQKKSAKPAAAAEIPSFESEVIEHHPPVIEQSPAAEPVKSEEPARKKPGPKPKAQTIERRKGASNSVQG